MESRYLELAAELCELVGADDLLAFLGLEPDVSPEDAQQALKKKRGFYQSMQANPKHRDKAKFFIKHYRALDAVMAEPAAHLAHMAAQRAADKLPMLEMAIDSVLADGVLTPQEEEFIRESAETIGIDDDTFQRVLDERLKRSGAVRAGAVPAVGAPPPPPPTFGRSLATAPVAAQPAPAPRKKKRVSQGWWTQDFTDLLLRLIPEGTTRMVDIACASAWSALALLPERPELEYLGIDRDEERLALARRTLTSSPIGTRVVLAPGFPHELPLADDSVDLVLSVMALRYFYDTEPIFREAHRVLKEGGRFVVVEPDGLSQQFYFDGHLNVLNNAFREFMREADRRLGETRSGEFVGRPGLAIGPELGHRLRHAGFTANRMLVHPIQGFREEASLDFAERVSRVIDSVSTRAELTPLDKPVRHVRRALNNMVEMIGKEQVGLGGHLQPAFVCVGVKT
ncbi:MAG: methyltransferase domain-containing protein [Myxococcales bacterium]|nr:methyltransferase domain-containing protein [Myxococcales bacterium]MCB9671880.1 methyltransferase domain-containing protein [Alphaproteobacteria bacterium]MCB9693852.1 methyltransferase domain-containing protein [Alphaproteobacteria bacterium]